MDLIRPLRKEALIVTTILAAVVWAWSGRVAAQDEPKSGPAQERSDNAAHPTTHLTGCVERGVIPGSFMLTQVHIADTGAGSGLGKVVGKRVAITGRLTADRDQTGLGTRGGPADSQTGGDDTRTRSDCQGGTSAGGDTAAVANIRQLDAETIRTVAGTCTPATDRR